MNRSAYLAVVLAPVAALVALCAAFLYRGGELDGLAAIAQAQQERGGLYGTAVHADTYDYKFALLKARRPEVAILGSSRVLTFRQDYFKARFVNMGLVASSAGQMEAAVRDLLKQAAPLPRLVILGIDHYWGNPAWARSLAVRVTAKQERVVPNLLLPAQWLVEKKFTPRELVSGLMSSPVPIAGAEAWGWGALKHGDGFAADGSYVYGSTLYGRAPAADARFADTLSRIAGGQAQFAYGRLASEDALAAVDRTIALLRDAGIRTVVFIPPLAPALYEQTVARAPDGYRYIRPFLDRIARAGAAYADMMNPATFGSPACEFVDGFHVGEVGAARILKALAPDLPSGTLELDRIDAAIAARAGHAGLDDRFARPGEREADFLTLGCAK